MRAIFAPERCIYISRSMGVRWGGDFKDCVILKGRGGVFSRAGVIFPSWPWSVFGHVGPRRGAPRFANAADGGRGLSGCTAWFGRATPVGASCRDGGPDGACSRWFKLAFGVGQVS